MTQLDQCWKSVLSVHPICISSEYRLLTMKLALNFLVATYFPSGMWRARHSTISTRQRHQLVQCKPDLNPGADIARRCFPQDLIAVGTRDLFMEEMLSVGTVTGGSKTAQTTRKSMQKPVKFFLDLSSNQH